MITPWCLAVEPFSPSCGGKWADYVEWSGLTQLEEVISLDSSLCPRVIKKLEAEDWNHNVTEDYVSDFFRDREYLQKRIEGIQGASVLAAIRNPAADCRDAFPASRFGFKGHDLVERGMGMSALTNCGGFPLAFANTELSSVGLVSNHLRALEIQAALLEHYPGEQLADALLLVDAVSAGSPRRRAGASPRTSWFLLIAFVL